MPVAEVSPRHEVIPNGQPRVEACSQRGDHIVTWKILSGTALVFFLKLSSSLIHFSGSLASIFRL